MCVSYMVLSSGTSAMMDRSPSNSPECSSDHRRTAMMKTSKGHTISPFGSSCSVALGERVVRGCPWSLAALREPDGDQIGSRQLTAFPFSLQNLGLHRAQAPNSLLSHSPASHSRRRSRTIREFPQQWNPWKSAAISSRAISTLYDADRVLS